MANTVQTATLGKVATRYREGSDEIDVRLRFKKEYRDSLDEIRSIPIRTAAGQTVYLEQVADITTGQGPIRIDRENQIAPRLRDRQHRRPRPRRRRPGHQGPAGRF